MWTFIFIVLNAMIVGVGVYQAIRQFRGGKNIARTILVTVSALVVLNGLVAILNTLISSKTQEELAHEIGSIKEEQRGHRAMLGEVLEYLDGLPESKNPKLKRLFEKGDSLYRNEAYPDAIDAFEACLRLKTEDSERLALLILIGNAHYTLGKLGEAREHYREAGLIGRRIGDSAGTAAALGNIGLIYKAEGDLDQALIHYQEVLQICTNIGYRQGEATALSNIAGIHFLKRELDQASENIRQALQIDREMGDRQAQATDLNNLGLMYRAKGELDEALKYGHGALRIFREIAYKQGEASALGNIGMAYQDSGDVDQALKCYQEALRIHKEMGFKVGEARDLNNIGLVCEIKGDLEQALKYYQEALEILEEIGVLEQIRTVRMNVQTISQRIKQKQRDEK